MDENVERYLELVLCSDSKIWNYIKSRLVCREPSQWRSISNDFECYCYLGDLCIYIYTLVCQNAKVWPTLLVSKRLFLPWSVVVFCKDYFYLLIMRWTPPPRDSSSSSSWFVSSSSSSPSSPSSPSSYHHHHHHHHFDFDFDLVGIYHMCCY